MKNVRVVIFLFYSTFYFEYVILSILNLQVYLFYLFDVFGSIKEKKNRLVKKIWRNALVLKNKKVQGIFGKMIVLALLSSAVFQLQNYASDFF